MINYGIFRKTLTDSLLAIVLSFVGLVAFVILFVWAMLNMGQELLEFVSKLGFVKKIMEMSLGIQLEGEVSINMLFAVCFTHGVMLMTVWGVLIATATRVTAGEVERGTADMLLSLPFPDHRFFVPRRRYGFSSQPFFLWPPSLGFGLRFRSFSLKKS